MLAPAHSCGALPLAAQAGHLTEKSACHDKNLFEGSVPQRGRAAMRNSRFQIQEEIFAK